MYGTVNIEVRWTDLPNILFHVVSSSLKRKVFWQHSVLRTDLFCFRVRSFLDAWIHDEHTPTRNPKDTVWLKLLLKKNPTFETKKTHTHTPTSPIITQTSIKHRSHPSNNNFKTALENKQVLVFAIHSSMGTAQTSKPSWGRVWTCRVPPTNVFFGGATFYWCFGYHSFHKGWLDQEVFEKQNSPSAQWRSNEQHHPIPSGPPGMQVPFPGEIDSMHWGGKNGITRYSHFH